MVPELADLMYELPRELIAQHPSRTRSESRLLVARPDSGTLIDTRFERLVDYLGKGDLLVLNDTGVIRARLRGSRSDTGGKVELLLVERSGVDPDTWTCILRPSRRAREGVTFDLDEGFTGRVLKNLGGGRALVGFRQKGGTSRRSVEEIGEVPLPPYVRRSPTAEDEERYQTVYAAKPGAVAAPTAGLHFTTEMLDELDSLGVEKAFVTLHVGPGTFAPLRRNRIEQNRLESERFSVTSEAWNRIRRALDRGRRIVSVGTTSTRVLETLRFMDGELGGNECLVGRTDLFIYPPYRFRNVSALITNFHLPGTSLLALVAAFMGLDFMKSAYEHAVSSGYRFYSYGDAMLITGGAGAQRRSRDRVE